MKLYRLDRGWRFAEHAGFTWFTSHIDADEAMRRADPEGNVMEIDVIEIERNKRDICRVLNTYADGLACDG